MEIKLHEITIREIFEGYHNDEETGQVVAYGGKLNVRPAYQREFVYDDKKQKAVMHSILNGFPLNVMYWSENSNGTYEMLDGQQRTISICEWLVGHYSIFANPNIFAGSMGLAVLLSLALVTSSGLHSLVMAPVYMSKFNKTCMFFSC